LENTAGLKETFTEKLPLCCAVLILMLLCTPAYIECSLEVAGVTFSDSDSAPVPTFLNPGQAIFQIWESDSCSDSGYSQQSNSNLPMFLL